MHQNRFKLLLFLIAQANLRIIHNADMDGIFENARSRGLDEYSFLFRDRQRPNYHRRDQNRHRESFNHNNNNNNNNSSPSILQGVESRTEVLLSLHLKIIHVSVWHYQGWLNEKGNSFRGERIVF